MRIYLHPVHHVSMYSLEHVPTQPVQCILIHPLQYSMFPHTQYVGSCSSALLTLFEPLLHIKSDYTFILFLTGKIALQNCSWKRNTIIYIQFFYKLYKEAQGRKTQFRVTVLHNFYLNDHHWHLQWPTTCQPDKFYFNSCHFLDWFRASCPANPCLMWWW